MKLCLVINYHIVHGVYFLVVVFAATTVGLLPIVAIMHALDAAFWLVISCVMLVFLIIFWKNARAVTNAIGSLWLKLFKHDTYSHRKNNCHKI